MSTPKDVTKQLTLLKDADSFMEAIAFVMDAVDELGEEVDITISHKIKPGEEGERDLFYKVRVQGMSLWTPKEDVIP